MSEYNFNHRHILSIADLSANDIHTVLDCSNAFYEVSERSIKKVPTLRGRTIINYFAEPSTRTRTSFEIAGKRLSADVINVSDSNSSSKKGETLLDTARNLDAMQADILVVRHKGSGVAQFLSKHVKAAVVNAGDGMNEHPSQALLDCATIRKHKGNFEGLNVAIIGDIAHSRVARSNIYALRTLGAKVRVAAPRTLLPKAIESTGSQVFERVEPALEGADVVMVLRLQKERGDQALIPNEREYSRYFGISRKRLQLAKPDALVMHPGPMNRGVEIESDVADGVQSVILEQVTFGVAVRMGIFYLLCDESA